MKLEDSIKLIPDLISILKSKFAKEKFSDIKLEDGTIVRYEGDMPQVGMPVVVIDEAGNEAPLADGEYVNPEDGMVMLVVGGKISELKPGEKAAEGAAPVQAASTESPNPKKIAEIKEYHFLEDLKAHEKVKEIFSELFAEKDLQIESLKSELKKANSEIIEQKELLKETFSLVEKMAESPSEAPVQKKKDEVVTNIENKFSKLMEDAKKLSQKTFKN